MTTVLLEDDRGKKKCLHLYFRYMRAHHAPHTAYYEIFSFSIFMLITTKREVLFFSLHQYTAAAGKI